MIQTARALLAQRTPLKRDCGRLCAAACCQADEDGQGGMLLFPGEERLYDPLPDWARLETLDFGGRPAQMLVCEGRCDREHRPLACRIFPLTPTLRQGKLEIALDRRAWAVCPLMDHGLQGLDPAFVQAVREAMTLLLDDPACAAYFKALTEALDGLAQFQRR